MSNWSEGYVDNINYTAGYYHGLNPQNLTIPFLMAGLQPPSVINACELGFGLGVSLNIHAASGQAKWYGTDFNPSQVLFAQSLASCANLDNVVMVDQSFAEFCQRDDLPEFDFIGLHGIWSWISEQNREIIIKFIAKKLKVGGVLYISYNTLPGWSAHSSLRHLFSQHYNLLSSYEESIERNIKQAIKHTEKVISLSPNLLSQAPLLKDRVNKLYDGSVNYLAHEYLNQDWHPMYFSEIEQYLKKAKLSYACSAYYLEDFEDVLFDSEQKELFSQISDVSLQQTTKDFLLNKQFRADYWVKGQLRLDNYQIAKEWKKLSVLLIKPRDMISIEIKNYQAVDFKKDLFEALIQNLADYQEHSVASLCQKLESIIPQQVLFNMLAILNGRGELVIVQPKDIVEANKYYCQKLNQEIIDRVFTNNMINYLASPVSGGAISYTSVEMLFLSAYKNSLGQEKWIEYVWGIMQKMNQLLVKDGQSLLSEEDNLAELERMKNIFIEEKLRIAINLAVI